MNRRTAFRTVLKLALLSAVLWAIYVAGVELGKRRTHTKIVKAVNQYFWPPEETPIPAVWTSSPFGYDPFSTSDPFSGADPFGGGDPFGGNPFANPPESAYPAEDASHADPFAASTER